MPPKIENTYCDESNDFLFIGKLDNLKFSLANCPVPYHGTTGE
jgi:hypothetical protein